ncbi:asparagine synthase-related protein [Nocardia asiatica]|uniref:asparagine synthase-related protein n=1 Tax=Nocardia asiatica TaxID=209252 RepID=UPI002458AA3F|nr:asparagine synthase-related protein [Nocardia asiatica]
MIPNNTADQTGIGIEYVAELRDISSPNPQMRRLTDPIEAARLVQRETLDRLDAIFRAQSGPPVLLLSGGVDSILVAAAAVRLGVRPHAITVVSDTGTDEANATAAASALGLPHDVISLTDDTVAGLASESVSRLGLPELWEVSYAVPLLATTEVLDRLGPVGSILMGSGADAIFAGGRQLRNSIDSPEAVAEMDAAIRKESAGNFVYDRLIPDFYPRVMGEYADRITLVFQTLRFWELAEAFAPPALYGVRDDVTVDKLCVRLACEGLLPESVQQIAWAKKSAIQRSAGIMDALAGAARKKAAALPGAQTYTDPMTEQWEAVATRLFLALLASERSNA